MVAGSPLATLLGELAQDHVSQFSDEAVKRVDAAVKSGTGFERAIALLEREMSALRSVIEPLGPVWLSGKSATAFAQDELYRMCNNLSPSFWDEAKSFLERSLSQAVDGEQISPDPLRTICALGLLPVVEGCVTHHISLALMIRC